MILLAVRNQKVQTVPLPKRATNITEQFDDGEMQPSDDATIEWRALLEAVGGGGTFWLTTVDRDLRPHTRPLFAVISHGALHVSSSATASKTAHLAAGVGVSVATASEHLDIVWSGSPSRVTDRDALAAVAEAYRTTYGWDVAVDDSEAALRAPYGAPTAGAPPYEVFRVDPSSVHAVATGERFSGRSTRWDRFGGR